MASRSNSGMGVLVALVIFIMLTVTLLLLLMLFYTKADRAAQDLATAEAAARDFITMDERNRDDIGRLKSSAQAANRSVVMYQREQLQNVMSQVAGNRNLTPEQLSSRMDQLGLQQGESLVNVLTAVRTQLQDANSAIESLQQELASSQARLAEEVSRREVLQQNQQAAFEALNQEVEAQKARADRYAAQIAQAEQNMEGRVGQIRDNFEGQVSQLNTEVERRDLQIGELSDAVTSLQNRLRENISPTDEGAQKDGEVVRVLDNDEIFIDLGRKDHIVLGMTFNVYGSVLDLRPDARGNVPPGKATVEVTRIDEVTSTARVIRSTSGRAVVEGDVLVNPVYDRNKDYSFFVFGRFDLDGENGPSDIETEIVNSRIRQWGGTLRDEFAGDIDFLVLGAEPSQPLAPRLDATGAEILEYRRQRQFYEDYQSYLQKAERLSIPVLSQNRLLTLIGYYQGN